MQGTGHHAVSKNSIGNTLVPSSGCKTPRRVLQPGPAPEWGLCSPVCKPRLQTQRVAALGALCNARGINALQH